MSKTKTAPEVLNTKRFVVRQKILGQGKLIKFTNKKGDTYTYDHDKVYEANKKRFDDMPCWNKYKTYTATNSVPTFAREFVVDSEVAETDS